MQINKHCNKIIIVIAIIVLLSVGQSWAEKFYQNTYIAPERVVRVYDGDTFYVNLPCGMSMLCKEIPIRLAGIDTPEMRTKDKCLKEMAVAAKIYLDNALRSAKTIKLVNPKRGKFYRIVATVIIDGIDVGQEMVKKGIARPYHGKKKKPWVCTKAGA